MRITQTHLQFYREKKAPLPSWAKTVEQPKPGVSIDALINLQVSNKRGSTEPHNVIALIRGARRIMSRPFYRPDDLWPYKTFRDYLHHLAWKPCGTDPVRRTRYAQKWYKRLYGKVTA